MIVAVASCHPPDDDPKLEGEPITSLTFEYLGPKTVEEPRLLERMKSKPGTCFSARNLDADVKSLWEAGLITDLRFEARLVDESVRLTAVVTPPPACGPSPFVGNTAFSDQKLARTTGIKVGERFDFEAASKIEEFYHQHGYPDATVAVQSNASHSATCDSFVFLINEGIRREPAPPLRALHPR